MKKVINVLTNGLIAVVIATLLVSCGGESFDWPDGKLAQMLPTPSGTITSCSSDDETLSAEIKMKKEDYSEYVKQCKEKGFVEGAEESQSDEWFSYNAKNDEGYELSLSYDKTLSISLYSPEWLKDIEDESNDIEEQEKTDAEKKEKKTKNDSKTSDDVSVDFKQTMDEYEDFMNDYIDFMEDYKDSDDVLSMATDYTKLMSDYEKYAKKIDKIDEDSLSEEDLAYYVEVTTRVNKRLAEANI